MKIIEYEATSGILVAAVLLAGAFGCGRDRDAEAPEQK
jgi:hypothetical protein